MPAAIPLVAAGVGAAGSIIAGNKAASAQEDAANAANATQMAQYNQTRADQTPWRTAGGQAVDALSQWYGLGGVSSPTANTASTSQPGYSGGFIPGPNGIRFPMPIQHAATATPTTQAPVDYNKILSNLPGYQFQLDQGQQATERNLAARGLLDSGAADKALTQYGQGMASDYATQYVNGLQSLAGLGQTSVQNTGVVGANAANQIGSNQIFSGNARASGYAATGNAINAGLSGLVGAYGASQTPSWQPGSYITSGQQGNDALAAALSSFKPQSYNVQTP